MSRRQSLQGSLEYKGSVLQCFISIPHGLICPTSCTRPCISYQRFILNHSPTRIHSRSLCQHHSKRLLGRLTCLSQISLVVMGCLARKEDIETFYGTNATFAAEPPAPRHVVASSQVQYVVEHLFLNRLAASSFSFFIV